MQGSIRTNNSKIKHKRENHGENIYCRPIYGLNTKIKNKTEKTQIYKRKLVKNKL